MSYFLDISKLSLEDIEEIKHLSSSLSVDFNKAMWIWMNDKPGKIKVLGEMKNGEIIRDEINEDGVKEYKGNEALSKIFNEVLKNKRTENGK